MSKRSVWCNGLKVRIEGRDQLGRDHLRIDPITPFGDGLAQCEDPAFRAKLAHEPNLCTGGCKRTGARQEGHVTKFGNWPSNFRSAAFKRPRPGGCIILT